MKGRLTGRGKEKDLAGMLIRDRVDTEEIYLREEVTDICREAITNGSRQTSKTEKQERRCGKA